MKKMIKSAVLLTAMVFISASAFSQMSVNVGYANTKTNESDADPMNGITAGVGYDFNIQGNISILYGLNYSYFRNKSDEVFGIYTVESGHYLDIPVQLAYGLPLGENLKVLAFAGPKFVLGLAGGVKTEGDGEIVPDINYYDGDNSLLNRFDIQVGLGAGVQVSQFLIKAGYDIGMLNLNATEFEALDHKRNQFYVTVGYAF